jgi:cysteinyl-tRNA synthetase
MSKSLGNIFTLDDLRAKGIEPLAYRYWLLTAHYRTQANFTWEAVQGAQVGLDRLRERISSLPDGGKVDEGLKEEFLKSINDDLNTSRALAVAAEGLSPADEKATWLEFDKVLGLDLGVSPEPIEVPEPVRQLVAAREAARVAGNFAQADELRAQIEAAGFTLRDTPEGPQLKAKS